MNWSKEALDYEKGLVKLAVIMANGESEEEPAWELREFLGDLEYKLAESERKMMEYLSGDLYMLEDDEIFTIKYDDTETKLSQDLDIAIKDGEYYKALELLRMDSSMPLVTRAWYRSCVLTAMGLFVAAKVFRDYWFDNTIKQLRLEG